MILLRVQPLNFNSSANIPFWFNMLCTIALCVLLIRIYFAVKDIKPIKKKEKKEEQ